MQYLKDIDVRGKRVLVRVDFNVPLDEAGNVTDDTRIKEFIPTLKYIFENGGSAVLMSHLGSPTAGKPEATFSLRPAAAKLSQLIEQEVPLAPDCIGSAVEDMTRSLKPGSAILLENLRFHAGETKNDPAFAAELAKMGDVYICDAFGTIHRAHASMVGVPAKFKQKGAGLLVQRELEYFEKALGNPKRPLCVVLGGSKVSTKLNVLMNIVPKADKLIIGGAMANTFLAAQGIQMGRSLYEPDLLGKALEILGTLARREAKLYLPVDLMVAPSLSSHGLARAVPVQEVPAELMALDIGPASRILFKEALVNAETILWNGPMGAFENEDFAKGTTDMIEAIASAHGLSIVGGGDTDVAIHQMQLAHKFGFISTGGGAFLALLEGSPLPALQALE